MSLLNKLSLLALSTDVIKLASNATTRKLPSYKEEDVIKLMDAIEESGVKHTANKIYISRISKRLLRTWLSELQTSVVSDKKVDAIWDITQSLADNFITTKLIQNLGYKYDDALVYLDIIIELNKRNWDGAVRLFNGKPKLTSTIEHTESIISSFEECLYDNPVVNF